MMIRKYIIVYLNETKNLEENISWKLQKYNYDISNYISLLSNDDLSDLLDNKEISFETDYSYKDLVKVYYHHYARHFKNHQEYEKSLHNHLIKKYQYNPQTKEYGHFSNLNGEYTKYRLLNNRPVNIYENISFVNNFSWFLDEEGQKHNVKDLLEYAKKTKAQAYLVELIDERI